MKVLGKFWHREGAKIRCDLCPRECLLSEGQRGFCFVRQNIDNDLFLTTYGLNSGMAVDPIEKKPLYHFFPGSTVMSFGTAGCNLGCRFCQNWGISKAREATRLSVKASPGKILDLAKKHQCKSVAFTYNDPVIFAEFAVETAKILHQNDIFSVAVTAGYINPEARKYFFSAMDAANVDLKSFREDFYNKNCFGHLQPVLDTLLYLKNETDVWFEITNLLIPGENDSSDEIDEMTRWIVKNLGPGVPLHFTAFHPDYKMLDKPKTSFTLLKNARDIAIANGLHYVYTGNVIDPEGSKTLCPECGDSLISRDWFEVKRNSLNGNRCSHCGAVIEGIFV